MKRKAGFLVAIILALFLFMPTQANAVAGGPVVVHAAEITVEEAVMQAMALYMNYGLDQNAAFLRVQAILPQLLQQPSNVAQIVANDLITLQTNLLAQQQAAALQAQQAAALQAQQQAAALQAQQAAALQAQQQAAALQAQQQYAAALQAQQQYAAALQAQQAAALQAQQEMLRAQAAAQGTVTYIGNKNSGIFHYPFCSSVAKMANHNKVFFYGGRSEPATYYRPCKICNP
ncbi:MAG: hypothetical protein IJ930_10170 [Lachnospiraceae bacterium]|nr:hypothetical protein [Lachnospiraceae bacterium]